MLPVTALLGDAGAALVLTVGPLLVLLAVGWLCYRAGQHDAESHCWTEYSRWARREAVLTRVLREDTRAMPVLPRPIRPPAQPVWAPVSLG